MEFLKIRNNIDEESRGMKMLLKIYFYNIHLYIAITVFFNEKIDNYIPRSFFVKTFVLINKNFFNLLFFTIFYFTNLQKIDVILQIEID